MNDRQEAKFNMFQAILNVCRKNEQVYADVPAFVDNVKQLDENIIAISQNALQQSGTTPIGFSAEKNIAIDLLTHEAVKVANGIYVYAITIGDRILLTKVSVNKSLFYNGHYYDALILAKNIADEAHKHAPNLTEYGIDASAIEALDKAITGFEQVINKPMATIGEHKLYTDNLKQLFTETDSILYDRLDKLVVLFKISSPEFYFLYKNSRNVINTAKRSAKTKEE
jgi:hypothetical protein